MREHDLDSAWSELGRIDFLLNELARAVERREIPPASYDTLAPRYLARRAELVGLISAETSTEASTRPSGAAGAVPTVTPPVEHPEAIAPAGQWPSAAQAGRERESAERSPGVVVVAATQQAEDALNVTKLARREPRPVPWTTILTFVGAFLVVVASAIFAVATWEYFSVGFRLTFLGALTVGFFVTGEYVRTRLNLVAGGIALTVVGSAMLLFDGWIIINGLNLTGPLPWAVVLLVCSGVYWFIEVRISGAFFGAIGAAAQAAWWWLLGAGLGWTITARLAACALVALAWAWAGRRARGNPELGSLALVLRVAAPVLAAITIAGEIWGLAPIVPGWSEVLACCVVGLAAALTFEISEYPAAAGSLFKVTDLQDLRLAPFFGFLGQAPIFWATFAAMPDEGGWGYAGLLAGLTVVYAFWELRRGGYFFAALALIAECSAWVTLGSVLDWPETLLPGIFGTLALSWVYAAVLLRRWPVGHADGWRGVTSMRQVVAVGSWILLALSTLAVPAVFSGDVLIRTQTGLQHVLVAAWMLAVWLSAAVLRRDVVTGAVAEVWSFWVLGSLFAWGSVESGSPLFAVAFIALAAVWLHGQSLGDRFLSLRPRVATVIAGIAAVGAVFAGAGRQLDALGSLGTWQMAVVFVASAAFWLSETVRDNELLGALLAPLSATGAVLVTAEWLSGDEHVLCAALAMTGFVWLALSLAIANRRPTLAERLSGLERSLRALGWAELAGATVAVPMIFGGLPLLGGTVTRANVVLSVGVLLLWVASTTLVRGPLQAAVTVASTFWTLAAAMSWALPSMHSGLYGLGLVALSAAWLHLAPQVQRSLGISARLLEASMRVVASLIVVGALIGVTARFRVDAWQTVALLVGGCVFWTADAVRNRWAWSAAPAAGLAVASAGVAGWILSSPNTLAFVAPASALLVTGTFAVQRRSAYAMAASCGAIAVASFAPFWSTDAGLLSLSLLALGLAWAIAAVPLRLPESVGIGALLGVGSILAALEALQPSAWVVVAGLSGAAFVLLVPSWFWSRSSGFALRAARASAIAGALTAFFLCVIATLSLHGMDVATWADLQAQDRVFSLFALGAYVVAASVLYQLEWGPYVGVAVVLLGVWDEFHLLRVQWVEFYTTSLAAYLVAMTYLYLRRAPTRRSVVVIDVTAVLVGLGVPVLLSLRGSDPALLWGHALWAVVLSVVAIGGGVLGRVRVYFFGGVVAVVLTALFRSFLYLVEFWWVTLGVIGLAMLVVALTWERRRSVLVEAGLRARDTFGAWR